MPRRWRHVLKKLTLLRGNGGKKARSPGRARKKPLKPIAQGRPGATGEPVVTCLRAFYFCTQGCGCADASGIPCALVSRKFGRMCKRAVLTNRPLLELSPLRPKAGRACNRARDSSGFFLNPNSCKGFEPEPSKE